MNVFVLCTGRCGSVTFTKACEHLTNYTVMHEGIFSAPMHFQFEEGVNALVGQNHIEVDPRLVWNIGLLDEMFGKDAFYVHLTRDSEQVTNSYMNKLNTKGHGIARAFYEMCRRPVYADVPIAMRHMVDSINRNITLFLKDKRHMVVDITECHWKFPEFCDRIGATGDIKAACQEFMVKHNAG